MTKKYVEAKQANMVAGKEVMALLDDKEIMLSEMANLKSTLSGFSGKMANRDAEIQKAHQVHKCETESLQGTLKEMKKKLVEVKSQCEAQSEVTLDRLKVKSGAEIEELKAQLAAMGDALESSKAVAEQEKNAAKIMRDRQTTMQQKLCDEQRSLKAQLEDAIGESQQLRDERAAIDKEMLGMKSEQESLISHLQSSAAECDSTSHTAKTELQEQSLRHSAAIESLKGDLRQLEALKSKIATAASSKAALLQDARAEAAKYREEAASLRMYRGEAACLRVQNAKLETQIDKLHMQNDGWGEADMLEIPEVESLAPHPWMCGSLVSL